MRKVLGLMAKVSVIPIVSVYPSPGARAAAWVPTLPLAPGRFSTTTAWPSTGVSACAAARLITSVMPPAL